VIGTNDIHNIQTLKGGIKDTTEFGARAIYGNKGNCNYYASINDNMSVRYFKNIPSSIAHKWCKGDIITVCLNLRCGNINFYFNGKKVTKTMSIQKNKVYYPVVSFSGDCQYELC